MLWNSFKNSTKCSNIPIQHLPCRTVANKQTERRENQIEVIQTPIKP